MIYTNTKRGFTLVELIVVVGILSVVSTVVLASNSKFGGVILLRNLAYDVALSIREAQTYGISVRRFGDATFNAGYGINISLNTPTTYILFADATVQDGVYGGSTELVKSFSIGRGYTITQVCVTPAGGSEICYADTGASLDLLFIRPEPDAAIRLNGVTGTLYQRARIVLQSPRGDEQSILIEATGQISVENTGI